ncbi:MAG: GMC family oxidoreductase N-terminal domain-containing protein, partial [Paracoccus sp. (in: a-proteobacteria)]|nr:GMC family oxidoreductase N-terminal domain-containing protein [Paracoccus sp. (in: a-proteobacteria)]
MTGAKVLRVLIERERAVGVEISRRGRVSQIRADREVVMAAGLFGTPQILMLSGLGPEAHLKQHGIQLLANSPMLGENLHDHIEAHIQVETDKPVSLNRYDQGGAPGSPRSRSGPQRH